MSNKIGHSHRHTSLMQVEIIPEMTFDAMNPPTNAFGLARWLIRNSESAKKEAVRINFSCQYCAYQGKEEDTETPVEQVSAPALEEQNSQSPGAESAKKTRKTKRVLQ